MQLDILCDTSFQVVTIVVRFLFSGSGVLHYIDIDVDYHLRSKHRARIDEVERKNTNDESILFLQFIHPFKKHRAFHNLSYSTLFSPSLSLSDYPYYRSTQG